MPLEKSHPKMTKTLPFGQGVRERDESRSRKLVCESSRSASGRAKMDYFHGLIRPIVRITSKGIGLSKPTCIINRTNLTPAG